MKQTKTLIDIEQLRTELRLMCQESLIATRQGDYRTESPNSTAKSAALNKAIMEAEDWAALQD